MNQHLATLLSGAALAMSTAAVWVATSAGSYPSQAPTAVVAPAYDPVVVAPCEGETPIEDLDDVMRERVNPSMTKLSFALFHDRRDKPERMAAVADAAGTLLGCVQLAAGYQPEAGVNGISQYYARLAGMQTNAVAVQVAAMELDEESARHWFVHLKNDCSSCHAQFRPATDRDGAP